MQVIQSKHEIGLRQVGQIAHLKCNYYYYGAEIQLNENLSDFQKNELQKRCVNLEFYGSKNVKTYNKNSISLR